MAPSSEQCQMDGCERPAEHTMTFRSHEDVDVCSRHRRRNEAIKYAVIAGLAVVLAGLAYGAYLLVF